QRQLEVALGQAVQVQLGQQFAHLLGAPPPPGHAYADGAPRSCRPSWPAYGACRDRFCRRPEHPRLLAQPIGAGRMARPRTAGRSKSIPALCAAGAPPAGTDVPCEVRAPGALPAGALGAVGASCGVRVDALSGGAPSLLPQAVRPRASSGRSSRGALEGMVGILIFADESITRGKRT